LSLVYDELRRLAASYMRRERANHTLQPTALVHEAYLRMIDQKTAGWDDRTHFFGVAARIMRQVLVDHARKLNAAKRKKDRVQVSLDRVANPSRKEEIDLVALDEALRELAAFDERKSQVVELRFFAGLTLEEVAQALGVSKRTAESDWFMARAWLRDKL
jgi:RNA polymerase sigma factor (TIGR02999 family)